MKTVKQLIKFLIYGSELKPGSKYVILNSNIL
jgi:hypothetical protein